MTKQHHYELSVRWTGNTGRGTSDYRSYLRDHEVVADGKPSLPGSSDPTFRGDPQRWSPEDLLVAALAQCHMLWFLNLASVDGIVVSSYVDRPVGTMVEHPDGAGEFTEVLLRPAVVVTEPAMVERVGPVHEQAHRHCFIARSVSFPVRHEPGVEVG